MSKIVIMRNGDEYEIEDTGELWGFQVRDKINREDSELWDKKTAIVQGFNGQEQRLYYLMDGESGCMYTNVPKGIILLERPSLKFKVGDKVDIVTGSRYNQKIVKSTIIKSVFKLPFSSVNDYDLQYESPDCRTKEGLRCVMYHINNKILSNDDIVTLITWE